MYVLALLMNSLICMPLDCLFVLGSAAVDSCLIIVLFCVCFIGRCFALVLTIDVYWSLSSSKEAYELARFYKNVSGNWSYGWACGDGGVFDFIGIVCILYPLHLLRR